MARFCDWGDLPGGHLAAAQQHDEDHRRQPPPQQHPGGGPPLGKPFILPHGPNGPPPGAQVINPGAGPPPRGEMIRPGGPPPGIEIGRPGGPPPGFVRPGEPPQRGAEFVRPGGPQFVYRGQAFERVRTAPFVYPPGWGDRRWEVGAFLPPFFLVRDYWYPDWGLIGLLPPPPDYQWVRYGSDLLMVDLTSGEVIDVVYDVFY